MLCQPRKSGFWIRSSFISHSAAVAGIPYAVILLCAHCLSNVTNRANTRPLKIRGFSWPLIFPCRKQLFQLQPISLSSETLALGNCHTSAVTKCTAIWFSFLSSPCIFQTLRCMSSLIAGNWLRLARFCWQFWSKGLCWSQVKCYFSESPNCPPLRFTSVTFSLKFPLWSGTPVPMQATHRDFSLPMHFCSA